MNQFILIIFIILTLSLSSHASWFTNGDQPYQQQIHDLQTQVAQQTHQNEQMIVVILVLSVCVVIALLLGAGIGSKARKAAKEVEN